ncbi:hypothetical protein MBAV_004808 [Candidatus Magnetobacterium bavaricum]|uniref:Uncharacterized protein n=1 Tax=Candidatus Magnetobacterium bavaricum TaxID=29290 RepID=A0A0F3GM48_9BACT|nr:hypothetical protein MBAV_004808 [Candidatus Magnetobacterium bavaricum]
MLPELSTAMPWGELNKPVLLPAPPKKFTTRPLGSNICMRSLLVSDMYTLPEAPVPAFLPADAELPHELMAMPPGMSN